MGSSLPLSPRPVPPCAHPPVAPAAAAGHHALAAHYHAVPLCCAGKVAVDYSVPHITFKSSATLTAAPKVGGAVG